MAQISKNGIDQQPVAHSLFSSPDSNLKREPIAIIGMGCRFPGANGPENFWKLLCNEVDIITEVPADRFSLATFYDPRPGVAGKVVTRWGGFLERVDAFDALFFGISPREAIPMDPQHRLLLEVAWEALEDGGLVPEKLIGNKTGVFVGMVTSDYEGLQLRDISGIDIYASAGVSRSVASGRISYAFDFHGPSVVIDTACSSSLLALHLACQSIHNGECDLALAGGSNLILQPQGTIGFSAAGMMAPDGHCKFGDASADGFVRSDGVGIVVVKPLRRALADGDPIHAVIRGSAANNDGQSSGFLMTPSYKGQEAVLREAYQNANILPSKVQYVEAHGAGTSIGDPIEIRALAAVLGEGRTPDNPCHIGSVKTNIGHTEGAAGIAGLIKAVLCLKHRALPKSLYCDNPNPAIAWDDLPLVIQQKFEPLPTHDEPALIGVSAFGISGTNVHIVLEEFGPNITNEKREGTTFSHNAFLLPLSAHTSGALMALAQSYQGFVPEHSLSDIAYTAGVRRTHHDHRLALVLRSYDELHAQLEMFLQGKTDPRIASGDIHADISYKIAFVFPGQGSQWLGMGRTLLQQEPVFREVIEQCDVAMRQYVDWSLLEQLAAEDATFYLQQIDGIQPALFSIQIALATLWRSWGIEPDAVVGHSVGEVAAAYIAGVLSLKDAIRIICLRSRLMKRLSGQGSMVSVELSVDQLQQIIAGYEDRVSVAVCNSPTSTVLSGDPAALTEILEHLQSMDVYCRQVKVDVAAHSPQIDALRTELEYALSGVQARPATLPLFSTVTGTVSDGTELTTFYWIRNLREPVQFSTAVQRLRESGHTIFLEISPHPILLSSIQQCLDHLGQTGTVLPSLLREEEERTIMLTSLASLYTLGCPISWDKLYPSGSRCVSLPSYCWQHERFWIAEGTYNWQTVSARQPQKERASHPLLGQHRTSAVHSDTYFWDMVLSTHLFPYLNDHRVQGIAVLPAAAYAEIALAAAKEAFGSGDVPVLKHMSFKKVLFLPEGEEKIGQLVLTLERPGIASFQFFSREENDGTGDSTWMLHASGAVSSDLSTTQSHEIECEAVEQIQKRCHEMYTRQEYYQRLAARGLQCGVCFQAIEKLERCDGEALGRIRLAEQVIGDAVSYLIHPALLDGCFQVLAATIPTNQDTIGNTDMYLPVGLKGLRIYGSLEQDLWSHAVLRSNTEEKTDVIEGDVFLIDAQGNVILAASGFVLQQLEGAGEQQRLRSWLYEWRWESKPWTQIERSVQKLATGRWLILADHLGIGEQLHQLLSAPDRDCVLAFKGTSYQQLTPQRYFVRPDCPQDYQQLLKDGFSTSHPVRGIIHLWSVDFPPDLQMTQASIEAAQEVGAISVMHLVQAITGLGATEPPHLWLVTCGTQPVDQMNNALAVAQAPIYGLGRVLVNEHPELHCRRVDLEFTDVAEQAQLLFWELQVGDREDEVALSKDVRFVHRLVRYEAPAQQENRSVPSLHESSTSPASEQPFRLEISTPGILDNLVLRAMTREDPSVGEVEIEVYATGLNFRDIMSAMGMLPGYASGVGPLGVECAGRISAIGKGVQGFTIGDEVVAIAHGSFRSYITVNAHLVANIPQSLSYEEAAALPCAFVTAHYALNYLARLAKGERVLIHSAAGGVGLAAICLAQQAGAEIFATAGSPEKRAYLKSLGVEHVMDSRSLDFIDEVLLRTDQAGVDIVLNSLAGAFIPRSLGLLAPYGRFVEIGKRDIYQNSQLGLLPFQRNLSFFAVDLDHMIREKPTFMGALVREVLNFSAEGKIRTLSSQQFSISKVTDAFRYMAQAKHIGKIVVTLRDPEARVLPLENEQTLFQPDATYLITGGLGGLGLTVAHWMVQQGAQHLVLVGRSGASLEANQVITEMQKTGAQIVVAKVDISEEQQVADLLAHMRTLMPPLRGIMHAAAVLDDGVLLQLNAQRFHKVMAPKIGGAWNLHFLTQHMELDFFVLFSSGATLLGLPGQGNYVASNAFLDALAHYRQRLRLPALSINWGPWSEIGLATRPDRGGRLALRGMNSIPPQQGLDALAYLLSQSSAQVAAMPVDWHQWQQFYPEFGDTPLLTHLLTQSQEATLDSAHDIQGTLRATILAVPSEERLEFLTTHLCNQVAQVLGLVVEKLDRHLPLVKQGLDSLMAVELKNRIQSGLGISVPVTKFLQGLSATRLAQQVLEQLLATSTQRPFK